MNVKKGRRRILITATVPETFSTILRGQMRQLAQHFSISLVSSPGSELELVEQNERVRAFPVAMSRGIAPFADLLSVLRMGWLIFRIRPFIAHSYTPKAGLVTMLASWLCRVPVRIHTFTGLLFPTADGFRRHLLLNVDRLICACATHIVPEGEGVKMDLQKNAVTGKNLNVIGRGNIAGVDTHHYSASATGVEEAGRSLRTQLGIKPDDFIFCFIGRINKDKGIRELMEAFLGMSVRSHLLIVGDLDDTNPPSPTDIKAMIVKNRIYRTGFIRDIRPALFVSDVLLLPSYREGFPNVVLQAGAMEKPVIASDINGCNEIIVPGLNGWLVKPKNASDLGRAMFNAYDMLEVERCKMGSSARRIVEKDFEQTDHWQRMSDFYSRLLN